MNPTAVIDVRDVAFLRNGKAILQDVSFTVRQGEHWVFLGANGAGKSTILSLCGAQAFPTAGTVDILGRRVGRVELQALRREIGHVNPRHPVEPNMTITDTVMTGVTGTNATMLRWKPSHDDEDRARDLLRMLGLERKGQERWATLSQGERGRALIARSLMRDPALLLLDEPSTGLDVAAREQLLDTITVLARSEADRASVLVTHHLEEIPETTTHALLIAHGRIVAAGPIDATLTSANVTTAFDYPVAIERVGRRWSARSAGELQGASR